MEMNRIIYQRRIKNPQQMNVNPKTKETNVHPTP